MSKLAVIKIPLTIITPEKLVLTGQEIIQVYGTEKPIRLFHFDVIVLIIL